MSNVVLEHSAGVVLDGGHRIKLFHKKVGVLTLSECTNFDVSLSNYGFKGGIMSLEKLLIFFPLKISTVILYIKTLARYTKSIPNGKNDVGMPDLLEVYQGIKELIQEPFEKRLLELGWPTVYGHGGTETQMDSVSDLTKNQKMSSKVAFEYPTEAVAVVVDDHHRKLISDKDGVLTPSKCTISIFSPANYGFKVPFMSPEKPRSLLRVISTVIPDKCTIAFYTKPNTIGKNDVGMAVLLEVRKGTNEFIQDAFENGQSEAALGWPTVSGHGTKTKMDSVSDLTKSEVVNAPSQTGKPPAQFMSKFNVDYEMVVSTQNDGARPFEDPDNDDTDCSCCGCCFIM